MRSAATLLSITAALTVVSCARSAESPEEATRIVLKVGHNGNERHPFQAGFEEFKRTLEERSGGVVEVQIFPNGQLATEEQASLMVQLGAIAASAASAGGGLAPFVPEADLFNLPFLFRDLEHFYSVLDGPVGRRVALKVERALDCIVLGYWFAGVRNVWNGKHPVRAPGDLKGLKIRVMSSPVYIETFNALGAQATPMSFGELYSALQQGVVDGAETDDVDLLFENFYEVTRHVSRTEHMFLAVGLIFSRQVFDDLPAEIQTLVLEAGAAATRAEREAMTTATAAAFEDLRGKGLEFHEVDREAFRGLVRDVYEANAARVGGLAVIDQVSGQ